ncbi:MAG: hypothetical protein ACRCS7_05100 [Tannerellaceae bacterium]
MIANIVIMNSIYMRGNSVFLSLVFSACCLSIQATSRTSIDSINVKYNHTGVFYFPSIINSHQKIFFTKPLYDISNQKQLRSNKKEILSYARSLIDNNYPTGVFIFNEAFLYNENGRMSDMSSLSEVRTIIDSLHIMGFKIMLRTNLFSELNGVFDISKIELDKLQNEYKFDGFLFDFRKRLLTNRNRRLVDSIISLRFDITNKIEVGKEQAFSFPFFLMRTEDSTSFVRIDEKVNAWDLLPVLLSKTISLGLRQPYAFPDITDNRYFPENRDLLDDKFIVRLCQMQSLMPVMQFPLMRWRVLDQQLKAICGQYIRFHEQMKRYMFQIALSSTETNTPMVQHMDKMFPNQGFGACEDQFMLGDRYLVAPMITSNDKRIVKLPEGKWQDDEGNVFYGPKIMEIIVPIDRLPFYMRIE